MSNFAFLPEPLSDFKQAASKAESHIHGDPRAACFHARFALEAIVHWLYRYDKRLHKPYDNSLGALLHESSFQNLLPEAILQKAKVIQRIGNRAVHETRPIRQYDALQVVKELHHIAYWVIRHYAKGKIADIVWDDKHVPQPLNANTVVPREQLAALEKQLATESEKALKQQQEHDKLNQEIQALRDEIASIREAKEQETDTHDYNEADTRQHLIDVELYRAGWTLDQKRDREYEVTGMPNNRGIGYVDYVLWGDDGKPLAVVEAKRSTADADKGKQQAKLYADCLEKMHGQRPLIFYTNGYQHWLWDDQHYPARQVAGFYNKAALERLIRRRGSRQALDASLINKEIAGKGRPYQIRAITSIFEQFDKAQRKALLVMATGTGKTRTSIALIDALQRANHVKRALFLADRVSLVNQAVNAFKKHLPESSPVNLVTEKNTDGRVYACTYPTMIGLINENKPNKDGTGNGHSEARFDVGYFDLIIIDEAHRSVYQKYKAIFTYFDSLLVGLTATPREEVDKNTYELFELEHGVPTDAYELETAVKDGFLVPPKVEQVDLRFPREGIDYNDLSDEEKEQWENTDWGDDAEGNELLPEKVNASAVNSWLFNTDTVDLVLKYLMEHGHKVESGDRLGKTIIFARNHKHAVFVEERFNHHYPQYAGHFARVIDNQVKYPQSLIDAFSIPEENPHIAISVDMLDTGIDVPEVVNLVFFKPVYSRIKFWQMIGRGTRLCHDLFAPGEDKEDFRVFDFCGNFAFFNENPKGIEGGGGASLATRLFRSRVQLLGELQASLPADDTQKADAALTGLLGSITEELHSTVSAMNTENFIVRTAQEQVERYQQRDHWQRLNADDLETLNQTIAVLPSEKPTDDVESRQFDLLVLQMQIAHLGGDQATYETKRQKVMLIAQKLEAKTSVPAVKAQAAYLVSLQEPEFWEGMNLALLEELRTRIRLLVPFVDKQERKIVYTNFKDEVRGISEAEAIDLPKMTGVQYEKKVRAYLQDHRDNIVIHRLRTNQPLTETDLHSLEQTLVKIGEEEGESLLSGLLERSEAPSLVYFIRGLVGMDRKAAQTVFSQYLQDQSLSSQQIRFLELIIDQLTERGVMEAGALYEPPFSDLHTGGADELFAGKDNVIDGIFAALASTQPKVEAA